MVQFWTVKGKIKGYKTFKVDFGGKILVLLQTKQKQSYKHGQKSFFIIKKIS